MTDRTGEGRNLLDRFTASRTTEDPSPQADDTVIDNLGDFGWLRGVRERSVMLELRKRNGNILAVQYGWIERMEFDPSEGITLHAGSMTIRLVGRNLNAEVRPLVCLFEGLTRHRVPWIRESGDGDVRSPAKTNCHTRIEWT